MKLLSDEEIKRSLEPLKGWIWNRDGNWIEKNFQFQDFSGAVCFLNRVAELAEEADHHPDLHLTRYRYLKITLTTHAAKGLTAKDFRLAGKIEEAAHDA